MILESITSQLKRDEGFRSSAYQDTEGFWTIGYGRLIDGRKNAGISIDEGEFLLSNDIGKRLFQLDNFIPWWSDLDHVRQHVLINMCFNLGIHGLLGFKNTLAKIKEGKYAEAAENMLKSRWAEQVPTRAFRLSEMMRTGKDI